MAEIRETMERTAHAAIFENGGDLDKMMAARSDDCIFQMLPMSLGHPPRNNKEFREHFATVAGLFRNMKMRADSEMYDPVAKKAALHLFSDADTPVGKYLNEYSIFLTFTEDGSKIVRYEEMLDSAYAAEFFGKVQAHMQQHGGDLEAAWAARKQ